jgi:hypothetical protein
MEIAAPGPRHEPKPASRPDAPYAEAANGFSARPAARLLSAAVKRERLLAKRRYVVVQAV